MPIFSNDFSDNNPNIKAIHDRWNKAHPNNKVTYNFKDVDTYNHTKRENDYNLIHSGKLKATVNKAKSTVSPRTVKLPKTKKISPAIKKKVEEAQKSGFFTTGVGGKFLKALSRARKSIGSTVSNHKVPFAVLAGALGAFGIYKLVDAYEVWKKKKDKDEKDKNTNKVKAGMLDKVVRRLTDRNKDKATKSSKLNEDSYSYYDYACNEIVNEACYVLDEFSNTVDNFKYFDESEIYESLEYLNKLMENSLTNYYI